MFIQKKSSAGGGKKIPKKQTVHASDNEEEPPSTPDKEEWINVNEEVIDEMFGQRPEELGGMSKVC